VPVDELRTVLAIGLAGLVLMLRLDAARFGAAEYDPGPEDDTASSIAIRLAWPAVAIALVAAIAVILPGGPAFLNLDPATFGSTTTAGLTVVFGTLGVAIVVFGAWYPLRRWPPPLVNPWQFPREALDALGTAIVDELAFRGVLLGLLLAAGVPVLFAFLIQLFSYGIATRLGATTRTLPLLCAVMILGAVTGWLAILTGGVAAPILVHTVVRFTALVVRGSPAQLVPRVVG